MSKKTPILDQSNNQIIGYISKSGKKCTIQHGFRWYEEHDTTQYNIFRVLVDSIPKGEPGYVKYSNARRVLHRLMEHPRFGVCAQIEHIQKVGNHSGLTEETTYLLNKYQFLTIAAALGKEYLLLATHIQHANLSPEELSMDASDFMRMIKKQAYTMLDAAANAETVDQTIARANVLMVLDDEIAEYNELSSTTTEKSDLQISADLANEQVELFKSTDKCADLPEDLKDMVLDRVEAAFRIRDAADLLLAGQAPVLETARQTIEALNKRFREVNLAINFLSSAADLYKDPELITKYRPWDNRKVIEYTHEVHFVTELQMQIISTLSRNKINVADPNRPKYCKEGLIEFALYAIAYDRMAYTELYFNACKKYKEKHGYTDKQIELIVNVVARYIKLTDLHRGLVVVEQRHAWFWDIYTAYRY